MKARMYEHVLTPQEVLERSEEVLSDRIVEGMIDLPVEGDLIERISDGFIVDVIGTIETSEGTYVGGVTGGQGGGVFPFKKEEWRKIGDKNGYYDKTNQSVVITKTDDVRLSPVGTDVEV